MTCHVVTQPGASCDATCTALSLTCVAERMQLVTSRDQIDFVARLLALKERNKRR